jgi:hypothetical protein
MDVQRLTLLALVIALLGAAAWLSYSAFIAPTARGERWEVLIDDPVLVGGPEDLFVYAGGPSVRPIAGDGEILVSKNGASSAVCITLDVRAADNLILTGEPFVGQLVLRSRIDDNASVWANVRIHGETDRGDDRLPETHALIAAASPFEIRPGDRRATQRLDGRWLIGHALRRTDGSIRKQGLVYSPLLRDKASFSDPQRLEFTLLLYDGDNDPLLHLVFRGIHVVQSPSSITSP